MNDTDWSTTIVNKSIGQLIGQCASLNNNGNMLINAQVWRNVGNEENHLRITLNY